MPACGATGTWVVSGIHSIATDGYSCPVSSCFTEWFQILPPGSRCCWLYSSNLVSVFGARQPYFRDVVCCVYASQSGKARAEVMLSNDLFVHCCLAHGMNSQCSGAAGDCERLPSSYS